MMKIKGVKRAYKVITVKFDRLLIGLRGNKLPCNTVI